MALESFLPLAIGVASALGQVHQRGLIHKDIKPANFPANSVTSQAWLMGFGIASRLPRERQAPAPPEVIAGTLMPVTDRPDEPVARLPLRSLFAGRHPLRDADRRTALRRLRSDGMGALPHCSPTGSARRMDRGRPTDTLEHCDEAPRQNCRGPLSDRRGSHGRSAEVPSTMGVAPCIDAFSLAASDVSPRLV